MIPGLVEYVPLRLLRREITRFLLIILASWAVNSLAMRILIATGTQDVIAFLLAPVASALLNFLLPKFFTFRK